MARPIFCLNCRTMHDPLRPCPPTKSAGGNQGRGAAAPASRRATEGCKKSEDEAAAPVGAGKAKPVQSSRPPQPDRKLLVEKLRIVGLSKNEVKFIDDAIKRSEALKKKNREAVKRFRDKQKKAKP